MQLTTPVIIPPAPFGISYSDVMMSMGSCFSDNIGRCMKNALFQIEVNPWGILFNPASIALALQRVLDGTSYVESDLVFANGLWHSLAHHGSFSCESAEETLSKANETLQTMQAHLKKTNRLLLTWGTSWVYERNGQVVANCHKLPSQQFVRRRMSVEEIVGQYTVLIQRLLEWQPSLKIIFTVSPIRHLKDGLHENQLSKATLLMAVETLCEQFSNVTYFPAYELVLDELRDYRFYDEDMMHPSAQAVQYIWEKFCATYMDGSTLALVEQAECVLRKLHHRPLYPNSPQAKEFQKQAVLEAGRIQELIRNL